MDRLISLQAGDRLTTSALIRQHQDLRDSGYFSTVEIVTLREQAEQFTVPVNMRLSPRKPNRYSFGVGYGTDTGARASASWERRRWDRRGHRSNLGVEISQVKNTASARYSIPLDKPLTDQLVFSTGYQDENTDTSISRKATVGTSRVFARGDWLETLSLDYQWEDFAVGEQADTSRLLIPGASWTRTVADDRTYASKGSRLTVGVRAADEVLASTASFTQFYLSAKLVRSFGRNSRILLRGDIGQTNVDSITDLPASLRFFAGGDYSVRGYDYQSLGPKDEEGEVIGGRRLLVGSAEYEYRFRPQWSAAVFYDAGNALENYADPLAKGAGVGLRWLSPIGAIRVDVAQAVSDPDRPWKLHLIIGPDL
jgi:translocation and assembly module TamA